MQLDTPRLIPAKEVSRLTSMSRTYIKLMWQSGDFPKPVKLGAKRIAWREQDVREWIQSCQES